jgi:hypothetical protein
VFYINGYLWVLVSFLSKKYSPINPPITAKPIVAALAMPNLASISVGL